MSWLRTRQAGPAAEVFSAANAERFGLMNAVIYDMPDGWRIIARSE